jgi:glucosamine--fructose-6-phosphate aminotransferase (isomerizing)
MCGIIGYLGLTPGVKISLDGLKMLQNRGYDSSGICSISQEEDLSKTQEDDLNKEKLSKEKLSKLNNTHKLILNKYASTTTQTAISILEQNIQPHLENTTLIMHTRWATHGAKTDANSHPHLDNTNKFAVVHNGIIENYLTLKQELISQYNITFKSQTDTEIIVNLISIYYDKFNNVKQAITQALSRLEGTWGLVIITQHEPDNLYCARHGSPLLIGITETYALVASEQNGFCGNVNNYICLNNNDLVILQKIQNKIIFENLSSYNLRPLILNLNSHTPEPYGHWTLKEIHEQFDSSQRAMGLGGRLDNTRLDNTRLDNTRVKLGGLSQHTKELLTIEHLIILGCGTSYYAGLYSLNIFKKISGFTTVAIYDGAEFNKDDIPKKGKTSLLLLSQSGETKDLHMCIEIAKDNNLFLIGVINVVDSLIAREVNCGVYLNAGKEVAVASTKAFTSQVIILYLISVWFAQTREINEIKCEEIIRDLRQLPYDIKNTIELTHEKSKEVAKYLLSKSTMFVLGKDICEAIAKEGSLKIKEIGYLNCNGYSSSALRHGPFALLDNETPVIMLIPNDKYLIKNNNVVSEIQSRGSRVISISNINLENTDYNIKTVHNETFNGLLGVIPLQLIAYELALNKGHNPDLPRNLAKTITVE